jgi:biopolymer transport protein ExbD
MLKRKRALETEDPHGGRPWVFFMIDCFMLILQFFILTFHFKTAEPVLPARLPEGGGSPKPEVPLPEQRPVAVHVKPGPVYMVDGVDAALSDLETTIQARRLANPAVKIRISYEARVPWGDVMALYDLAAKYELRDVGLVPLPMTELPAR